MNINFIGKKLAIDFLSEIVHFIRIQNGSDDGYEENNG